MFCYSNNGYSMKSVDDNYIQAVGEVLFDDYATTEQKNTAFPLYNSGVPLLTLDEKLQEIEQRYEEKFIAQEKLLIRTIASNHINQEAKVIIYQNSYNELADQKDLEILELLGGVE